MSTDEVAGQSLYSHTELGLQVQDNHTRKSDYNQRSGSHPDSEKKGHAIRVNFRMRLNNTLINVWKKLLRKTPRWLHAFTPLFPYLQPLNPPQSCSLTKFPGDNV